jgi:AcrR family transcriptional regulator
MVRDVKSETRSYSSPLRAEQAEATKARILDAAVRLLVEEEPATLSMNQVAEQAGVALRTVYRYFPTRDALFDGVVEWIGQRISGDGGRPAITSVDDFGAFTPVAFATVAGLEPLYRALMATQAGRASHVRNNAIRRDEIRGAIAEVTVGLDDDAIERAAAAIHLITSSHTVLFMHDYWGFDVSATAEASTWALRVLTDALRRGDGPAPSATTTSRTPGRARRRPSTSEGDHR